MPWLVQAPQFSGQRPAPDSLTNKPEWRQELYPLDPGTDRAETAPLSNYHPLFAIACPSGASHGGDILANAVVIRLASTSALSDSAKSYINSSNISLLWTAALFGLR